MINPFYSSLVCLLAFSVFGAAQDKQNDTILTQLIGTWQIIDLESSGFDSTDIYVLEYVRLDFQQNGTVTKTFQRWWDDPFRVQGTYKVRADTVWLKWISPEPSDGGFGQFTFSGDTLFTKRLDKQWPLVRLKRVTSE
jgi:hypothetical protein